jgi:serine O-acetyltransferase
MFSKYFVILKNLFNLDAATWGIVGYKLYRKGHPWIAAPFRRISLLMNIFFHPGADIGEGLCIPHIGPVVIGSGVKIGKRCTIFQGVTIGAAHGNYPVIGDDVFIGANACVIGSARIGNKAIIGAGAVVVKDVPDGATAVGNPARVILRHEVCIAE